jgi:hypothetical protein
VKKVKAKKEVKKGVKKVANDDKVKVNEQKDNKQQDEGENLKKGVGEY